MLTESHIAEITYGIVNVYKRSIGEPVSPSWDIITEEERDAVITAVRRILDAYIDMSPEANHMGWLFDRINAGWMYGDKKNSSAKEHPCLVPYNKLPKSQRTKNELFVSSVKLFKNFMKD